MNHIGNKAGYLLGLFYLLGLLWLLSQQVLAVPLVSFNESIISADMGI